MKCPLCGCPESEHQYDYAAWGCHYFDVIEGRPHQPVELKSSFFTNGLALVLYASVAVIVGVPLYLLIVGIINFIAG